MRGPSSVARTNSTVRTASTGASAAVGGPSSTCLSVTRRVFGSAIETSVRPAWASTRTVARAPPLSAVGDLEIDARLLAGDHADLDGEAERAQLGGDASRQWFVLGGAEQHHRAVVAGRHGDRTTGRRRRDQAA